MKAGDSASVTDPADMSLEDDAASDLNDADVIAPLTADFVLDETQAFSSQQLHRSVCDSNCSNASVLPTPNNTATGCHDTGYQTQSASQSALAAGVTSSTNLTNQFSNLQTSLGAASPSPPKSAQRLQQLPPDPSDAQLSFSNLLEMSDCFDHISESLSERTPRAPPQSNNSNTSASSSSIHPLFNSSAMSSDSAYCAATPLASAREKTKEQVFEELHSFANKFPLADDAFAVKTVMQNGAPRMSKSSTTSQLQELLVKPKRVDTGEPNTHIVHATGDGAAQNRSSLSTICELPQKPALARSVSEFSSLANLNPESLNRCAAHEGKKIDCEVTTSTPSAGRIRRSLRPRDLFSVSDHVPVGCQQKRKLALSGQQVLEASGDVANKRRSPIDHLNLGVPFLLN